MTVGELLKRISSHEITEWIAFYAIEAHDEAEAHRKASEQAKTGGNSRQQRMP